MLEWCMRLHTVIRADLSFAGVAALILLPASCIAAEQNVYISPIGDIDSDIRCKPNPQQNSATQAREEPACLEQFKDVVTRKGDNLTFKLENGKTTVIKSNTKACRQIPIGPCIVYELVGYMAVSGQFVLREEYYESVFVRLVSRRTGVVTKLEGYPRLSPNGKRFVAVASSDAWKIDNPISIFSATDPPRLEWRFPQPKEYEEYSFDGWDGEDRIKLHTITKPLIDTDVRRTTQGWVLRRPNGQLSSGTAAPP